MFTEVVFPSGGTVWRKWVYHVLLFVKLLQTSGVILGSFVLLLKKMALSVVDRSEGILFL